MGGRAGGGGAGGGIWGNSPEDRALQKEINAAYKKAQKEYKDRISQPRINVEKGTPAYTEAQRLSNQIKAYADGTTIHTDRFGKAVTGDRIDAEYGLKKVTKFVQKHGTSFEKSVAKTIAGTIRTGGGKSKVALVSDKQAWVLGKALASKHFKMGDLQT